MISIPVEVVNYICEFAAGRDKIWYPFFHPKTGEISWKVNPHCIKYIKLSWTFFNPIMEINITFYDMKTYEERDNICNVIKFSQPEDIYINKLNGVPRVQKYYFQFDDSYNNDKLIFRGMLNEIDHVIKNGDIYLDETLFANVKFGYTVNHFGIILHRLGIGYETY